MSRAKLECCSGSYGEFVQYLLFLHVPKTAGTSVRSMVADINRSNSSKVQQCVTRLQTRGLSKHMPCFFFKKRRPLLFKSSYKFTVVRNPWDWLWSFYRFIKFADHNPDTGRPWRHNLHPIVKDQSFHDFVVFVTQENGLELLPTAKLIKQLGLPSFSQSAYFLDKSDNMLVDRVLRFERLADDVDEMLEELGCQERFELKKLNVSGSGSISYQDAYDDEHREMVAEKFAKDISLLDYQF